MDQNTLFSPSGNTRLRLESGALPVEPCIAEKVLCRRLFFRRGPQYLYCRTY